MSLLSVLTINMALLKELSRETPRSSLEDVGGGSIVPFRGIRAGVEALSLGGLLFAASQGRQEQGGEDGNDGDDHEQFDQGEGPSQGRNPRAEIRMKPEGRKPKAGAGNAFLEFEQRAFGLLPDFAFWTSDCNSHG